MNAKILFFLQFHFWGLYGGKKLLSLLFFTSFRASFEWFGKTVYYGVLDITGICILVVLGFFYWYNFFKDLHWFAEKDPLVK